MQIIAIANQKGGCGKTTTAINLSACLAELNRSVLLIDLDPQGHATLGLNIKPEDLDKTMYNVLTPVAERKTRLDEVIIPISNNLDLAPANILLSAIEQELSGRPERQAKLFQAISIMVNKKSYDYIIIDCAPSLGLLTFNGLRASEQLIAPIETGFFSLQGMSRLVETVNLINKQLNCKIKVRALVTMFDRRTKFAREVKDEIYKYFSGNVFSAIIHNNVRLKEASSYGMPVIAYDKRCRGSEDYSNLAKEVIDWIAVGKKTVETENINLKQPEQTTRELKLTYFSPTARSVAVAGDFNEWVAVQENRMISNENGLWSQTIRLQPGKYRYKFVVDGQWIIDPNNPSTELDEAGNINSLLVIK